MNEGSRRMSPMKKQGRTIEELRINWQKPQTRPKKEYFDSICDKIMEFQRTGLYDLMYVKTKGLDWKEKNVIQNTIVNRRQKLKIWDDYVTEVYNRPQNIEVEPQEEVDTDKKVPYSKCSGSYQEDEG